MTSATPLKCNAVPEPAPKWHVEHVISVVLTAMWAACVPAIFGYTVPLGGMAWQVPHAGSAWQRVLLKHPGCVPVGSVEKVGGVLLPRWQKPHTGPFVGSVLVCVLVVVGDVNHGEGE